MGYRGRYAPSPTGDLHLGNAAAALFCAAAVKRAGGRLLMRVEDLDRDRVIAAKREEILSELRWLGISWDEGPDVGGDSGPYVQSERLPLYDAAIELLAA